MTTKILFDASRFRIYSSQEQRMTSTVASERLKNDRTNNNNNNSINNNGSASSKSKWKFAIKSSVKMWEMTDINQITRHLFGEWCARSSHTFHVLLKSSMEKICFLQQFFLMIPVVTSCYLTLCNCFS